MNTYKVRINHANKNDDPKYVSITTVERVEAECKQSAIDLCHRLYEQCHVQQIRKMPKPREGRSAIDDLSNYGGGH